MPNRRPIVNPAVPSEIPDTDSLIAGQATILSEQVSSLGTPASGYGVIYAKADGKLYFKNDAGTETDLTLTGTNPIIRAYTASDTWTKPTAANFWGAMVLCVGAGGGGGSGRRSISTDNRFGGGGGGGATLAYRVIRVANLSLASYSITVGAGGTGANSQTVDSTNGLPGGNGGNTTFGSLVSAVAGLGGAGGTTTSGSGGSGGTAISCNPARGPYSLSGVTGASATTTGNPSYPSDALNGSNGCAGGGAGGTNVGNGGGGGAIYDGGVITSGPSVVFGVGTNGTPGSNVANNILFDLNNTTAAALGTGASGGAAGDSAGTVAGGNGGNGGNCAGGGGGGGSVNGANSGAGGNGGNGLCFVIEYYGA